METNERSRLNAATAMAGRVVDPFFFSAGSIPPMLVKAMLQGKESHVFILLSGERSPVLESQESHPPHREVRYSLSICL